CPRPLISFNLVSQTHFQRWRELMRQRHGLMWAGLLLYTASFFLPAIQLAGKGVPGWLTAEIALRQWGHKDLFSKPSLIGFAVPLSGILNPLFVVTVIFSLLRRYVPLTRILRVVQLSFIPFPWMVFFAWYPHHIYLREGYVAWSLGMVLMLFSFPLSQEYGENCLDGRSLLP